MSAIAGQTARPNGLKSFKRTNAYSRSSVGKKIFEIRFFVQIPRATPGA